MDRLVDSFEMDLLLKKKDIIREINTKFNKILRPIIDLYISYTNVELDSFVESASVDFGGWLLDVMNSDVNLFYKRHFPSSTSLVEDNSIDLSQMINAAKKIVTMKSRVRKIFDDMEKVTISEIPSEKQICLETKEKLMKFLAQICLFSR